MSTEPHFPLLDVFGDAMTSACFTEQATVEAWIAVERALAVAQGELGVIPDAAVEAIQREVVVERIDFPQLRDRTRVVGYPILPLIEQLSEGCSPLVGRYLHWGATTQDIMDSGRALQIAQALNRVESLLVSVGDVIADAGEAHGATVMAGRTHAQHAVPITLGMKFSVWLDELARHLSRIRAMRPRVVRVQLFGAAGTAAALGPTSRDVRWRLADQLELAATDVPWHVARDGVSELGFVLAAISATCSKMAREVIDLSRPEVNELHEASGHLRGASSTMPQKVNPVTSETIVGLGLAANASASILLTAMVGGHERSAGEWQAEWDSVPSLFGYVAGSLARTLELVTGLQVDTAGIAANLDSEHGLLMAESLMMHLASELGRDGAHTIVYSACARARAANESLAQAVQAELAEAGLDVVVPDNVFDPAGYLGEAAEIVARASAAWADSRTAVNSRLDTGGVAL